jgi:hypothetical protein
MEVAEAPAKHLSLMVALNAQALTSMDTPETLLQA